METVGRPFSILERVMGNMPARWASSAIGILRRRRAALISRPNLCKEAITGIDNLFIISLKSIVIIYKITYK